MTEYEAWISKLERNIVVGCRRSTSSEEEDIDEEAVGLICENCNTSVRPLLALVEDGYEDEC